MSALEQIEAAASPWWLRALPYALVVVGLLAGLRAVEKYGEHVRDAYWKGVIAAANTAHAQQLTKLEAAARADEQAKATSMHTIDQQTIQGQTDEISKRDRTIADYRSGAVRLRDKFTCAAGADQRVREAATGAGQRDAASAGGLQQTDVEFLVRLASEADQAVTQLAACQAVVRTDRGEGTP